MPKITYFKEDVKYALSVDYEKIMSKGWYRRLREYLHTNDMKDIVFEVKGMYLNKNLVVYPKQKEIFTMLDRMDLPEVNVAIINCNPNFGRRSNGVAFANKLNGVGDYDLDLVNLFDKITTYERRYSSQMDYTLSHWMEQGVFLYNTSLTGFSNYHQRSLWYSFSRAVLTAANKASQQVVFLFIGSEAVCRPYREVIDGRKHSILRHDTLSYDALNEVNLTIDSLNGKDSRIKW